MSGIVRPLPASGRIGIPQSALNAINCGPGDTVDISVGRDEDGQVILVIKKSTKYCSLCGDTLFPEGFTMFHDKPVCHNCLEEIQKSEVLE